MEFKLIALISVFGVVASFTVPNDGGWPAPLRGPEEVESSFPSSYTDSDIASPLTATSSESVRDKRHLFKKGKGERVIYVNRGSYGGGYDYGRRDREVHYHHHHHHGYAPSEHHEHQYVPQPPRYHEHHTHHHHGGYYDGGYSRGSYYPQEYSREHYTQGPVAATSGANEHNHVDRGQGAAAVNNIAIIHARSGSAMRAGGTGGGDEGQGDSA